MIGGDVTTTFVDAQQKASRIAPAEVSDGAPVPSDQSDPAGALSIQPLAAAVELRGGVSALGVAPALIRAYHRARQRGELTPAEADRLAVGLLGEHPCGVWGWDVWVASAEGDA